MRSSGAGRPSASASNLVKGFTLDDRRLKNPPVEGEGAPDYFDELLERIRDIRASERRMYLRVREIFALAADYEPSTPESIKFFQVMQNKLHFATTGKTAAELIASRADHTQPNMGLTTWGGADVRKADVVVAKNYLRDDEIAELNRIVVMWLDYAEDQAKRRRQVFLRDWERKLDEFLAFNERRVLPHAGNGKQGGRGRPGGSRVRGVLGTSARVSRSGVGTGGGSGAGGGSREPSEARQGPAEAILMKLHFEPDLDFQLAAAGASWRCSGRRRRS